MIFADTEQRAWHWLVSLPRIPFDPAHPKRDINQFQLRVMPALPDAPEGGPGIGMVEVLARLPGLEKPVRGAGNTLYQACKHMHSAAWSAGVHLPFVEFHGDPRFTDETDGMP